VNRGRLAHTFRLERGEDRIVAKVSSLLPGDRTSKTVRVRKGTYRFFCALSNHEELGMYGTLVVK
jgi:plastocyanin